VIAALYVAKGGAYSNLEGVDPWDEKRDARLYDGPWPVVAHPPCTRWCRLAGLVEARWGHKKGDDGGTFAAALASVRQWGGVLEHPAYSDAWKAYDLMPPVTGGGWTAADFVGGWTCYIEQWRYGHAARKATWLYAVAPVLPRLRWGYRLDSKATLVEHGDDEDERRLEPLALVSQCGNHVACGEARPRLGKKAANATPPEFRDMLLDIARSCLLNDGMSLRNPADRDDFALPRAEDVEAHLVAKEIAKLMKRRKRKPLWGGGSRAFYAPPEWRARGESCGNSAALVVVHDGGDAAPYFNWDYGDTKAVESMGEMLNKIGYYAESCSSWATAIHRVNLGSYTS
jgi:hypothetical protein